MGVSSNENSSCGFEKLILREVNAFDNLQESRAGINKTRNMSPSFQTPTLLLNDPDDDKSVVVMIRHTIFKKIRAHSTFVCLENNAKI